MNTISFFNTKWIRTISVLMFFALAYKSYGQGYVTIGAQTTELTNDVSSPVSGYYESRKIQIIYSAAEIIAAGGAAGNIERLAWDVSEVYDGDAGGLPSYTIKMGHSASTSIPTASFLTGLSTVKTPFGYIPTLGFNDITFGTPFNWNGTDNVVVEICFNPAVFAAVNHGKCWNYTGVANNYRDSEADGADQCAELSAVNTTSTKPRVRFYMQQAVVTCDAPTTLTKYGTTATTTILSWTNPAAGSPVSYLVEIRTSGAAGSGATGLVSTWSATHPTNITTITGLTANTNYSAYVRTNCGGSGNSLFTSAVNFTTQCAPNSIPYAQNFDAATLPNLPTCTSREDVNGFTTWTTVTAPSSYTGKTLRYTYDFGGAVANDWFYTNGINLVAGTEYRLVYKYGANNPLFSERLKVNYGMSPVSTSMVNTLTNDANITAKVNLGKVDFIPSVTGVYYFGFHAYSLDNRDWLFLDDIGLDLKPVCNQVTSTNIYGFSQTTAIFSWTAALASTPPGNPASYQIEVRTSGAAGSGSTGLIATYTITHPSNITTFTGLTANTNYSVFIRTDCSGGDYSNWSSAIVFSTPCNAVNVPYSENFDGATLPNLNACTYKQDLNAGNTWLTATAPTSYSGKVLQYSAHASLPANDWFYTNGLNLTAGTTYRFSFKYGNSNSSFTEKLEVKYGTANSAETMSNSLFNFTTINSGVPQNATIDFSPASSGVYYFGFHSYSNANQSNLFLDNISLVVAPVCASPLTLNISSLSSTSVSLNWPTPSVGIPLNYLLELRTSGAGGSGSTGLVSTLSVTHPTTITTFSGLTANTNYTAFIKTDCGSGDFGSWVASNLFTTACASTTIPYTENFNTTVYPNIPSCTYEQHIGLGSWYVFNANVMSYPDFTDECLFFEYNSSNSADSWFYTSGLNLVGGITYNLSYKYRADVAGQSKMKVSYGNSPIATTMVNTLTNYTSISAATNVTTTSFTPSSSGVYYIGFNGYGVGNGHFILVDDLNITGVPANTNSSLSALNSSVGTLSPVFSASTFNYSVTLPFGSSGGATLNATVAAGTSTSVITSATDVTGTSPANQANVVVTAQDGSTSTYTVTYTVAPINTNSSLSNLTSSPSGSFSPVFSTGTTSYTVTLPFGTTGGATLVPTVAAGTSTTSITSATNVAGTSPLNQANVVVTAQSGATTTYSVIFVIDAGNSNSSLSSLTTSVGTLSPIFSSSTFNYTVNLPLGATGGATVTPTVAAGTSTTSITSATNVAGTAPANVATVVVTAQNGSTSTYTVTYVPAALSSDATLATLTPSEGTLVPAFDPSVTNYTIVLPAGSSGGATISGTTTNANATITSTTDAFDITGTAPDNTATITVTAENGTTTLVYSVVFSVGVGINENVANSIIASVYPNPTNGLTTLKVNNTNSSTIKVSVVSISGQVVSEKEIKTNNQETNYEINLSNQPKGVYFVKIKTNETTLVKRVIAY